METSSSRVGKRPLELEETLDGDGVTLVQHNKKKGKYSGVKGDNVTESRPGTPTTAASKEYRLTFPKGMTLWGSAIWIQEVASQHRNLSVLLKVTASSIVETVAQW